MRNLIFIEHSLEFNSIVFYLHCVVISPFFLRYTKQVVFISLSIKVSSSRFLL